MSNRDQTPDERYLGGLLGIPRESQALTDEYPLEPIADIPPEWQTTAAGADPEALEAIRQMAAVRDAWRSADYSQAPGGGAPAQARPGLTPDEISQGRAALENERSRVRAWGWHDVDAPAQARHVAATGATWQFGDGPPMPIRDVSITSGAPAQARPRVEPHITIGHVNYSRSALQDVVELFNNMGDPQARLVEDAAGRLSVIADIPTRLIVDEEGLALVEDSSAEAQDTDRLYARCAAPGVWRADVDGATSVISDGLERNARHHLEAGADGIHPNRQGFDRINAAVEGIRSMSFGGTASRATQDAVDEARRRGAYVVAEPTAAELARDLMGDFAEANRQTLAQSRAAQARMGRHHTFPLYRSKRGMVHIPSADQTRLLCSEPDGFRQDRIEQLEGISVNCGWCTDALEIDALKLLDEHLPGSSWSQVSLRYLRDLLEHDGDEAGVALAVLAINVLWCDIRRAKKIVPGQRVDIPYGMKYHAGLLSGTGARRINPSLLCR